MLPDENFNKEPNSAKNAKPIIQRSEKKPNFAGGIALPLSQKNSQITRIALEIFFILRLSLAWPCTGAHS